MPFIILTHRITGIKMTMIVKYLNPRNDIAFKKIFGTEKNKDILIHFLNDVIVTEGKPAIKEVTLLNPMQHPSIASKKQSIVDVLCEDETGVKYIVEMQVAKVAGFEKRAQFYAAKAYASQPDKGETYDHLKEVIFLAITEYEMFPKKKGYKCGHWILDKETGERDLKDFSFTFLELPKFKKNIQDLKTYEDKWLFFFKHANDPEDVAELLKNSGEVIQKAYHELEAHNWTEEELLAYEDSEKTAKDNKAREVFVKEEGRAEGKAEGLAEGEAKGEAKIAKIVKSMLKKGMSKSDISSMTDVPVSEIDEIELEG